MSLITRCPACGTMFKVVPDQLKISEGWVRCGHCTEVFDASAHLQHGLPAPSITRSPERQAPAADPEPSSGFSSSIHTETGESSLYDEAPDSLQLEDQARALRENPLDRPFELIRPDLPPAPDSTSGWSSAPAEPERDLHDLAFVRQARRKAFWRRPGVRATLATLFIGLAALLMLQFAMHDRDRLAASEPSLRPWLARLCEPLRCRLRAPRQIESIAIDNSSFNKLRGDAYRLNVTLKNQAAVEVAIPALELTLTDGQDQAVIRRVLVPSEFAQGAAVIPSGGDWSASVAIAVNANGTGSRIAGYRLLAFYP